MMPVLGLERWVGVGQMDEKHRLFHGHEMCQIPENEQMWSLANGVPMWMAVLSSDVDWTGGESGKNLSKKGYELGHSSSSEHGETGGKGTVLLMGLGGYSHPTAAQRPLAAHQ
jgi:hypothetical protein